MCISQWGWLTWDIVWRCSGHDIFCKKKVYASDYLGALLRGSIGWSAFGGWVEGWDPGCGGPWHGDTFECGRYYEGEREGVQTWDKPLHCLLHFSNMFLCFLCSVCTLKTFLLRLWVELNALLSHPFPLPHSPCVPLCFALGGWDTQLFFAFSCIIQSAAHSRSQWGVVCALVCPLVSVCVCVSVHPKCAVTTVSTCLKTLWVLFLICADMKEHSCLKYTTLLAALHFFFSAE